MSNILSKKGITPIIATILLLMMAIAIAASAFFWTSRMQNQLQGGIESYQNTKLTQLTTSAKIYDAEYNNTNQTLTIFIQNTGNTKLPIRDCCQWPRTDWILKGANQNTICNTDWTGHGTNCITDNIFCYTTGKAGYIEVGQIAKVELVLYDNCDITNDTIYPSGTVFSFSINFLGQTTAGGSFTKP